MDSFDDGDRLEPWTGEAEPLFRALEAAVEAGNLTGCHPWIRMRFEGMRWEPDTQNDVSSLASARARLKHGPLPTDVTLQVMHPEPVQAPGVFLLIEAHYAAIYIGGHGTDALRAKRAYDAARTVLVEQALADTEPEPSLPNLWVQLPKPTPEPDPPIPAPFDGPESALSIPSSGLDPEPPRRTPHKGIFGWMESHPVVMSVLVALIAAIAGLLAKIL